HHAPFDLGFMSYEFEKVSLELPKRPAFCSSLISRALFSEPLNHRLQTLVEFFKIEKGTAHRALDDAKACLEVTLKCIEKFGWDKTVDQLFSIQSKKLEWQHFSINALRENDIGRQLLHAMEKNCQAMIVYGTNPNSEKFRPIRPK